MTWTDDLRRVTLPDGRRLIGASFRGVAFFVEASDRAGGRRTVTHEFPFRDDPWLDDMGRKARVFHVEAYIVGDEYVRQRDLLLAALEDVAGPGELVHPYHGVRRAICTSLSARESRREGRMVVFQLEFAETPAQEAVPVETTDHAAQLDVSADAAFAATEAEFLEEYSVDDLPSFALESASNALSSAANALGSALSPVVSGTQELAKLTAQVALLTSQASSLVRQPGEVLGAFVGALEGLVDTVADAPQAVWRAFVDTYAIDMGTVHVVNTENREREADNLSALSNALRRLLVIEAARLMPSIVYDHHDDALDARRTIFDLLLEQEEAAGDSAYPALVQLRADISRAIPGDAVLARLVTIERKVAVPSILLAYQLYGSVDLEADIVARNRIRHPGFLSGELKVLSRG